MFCHLGLSVQMQYLHSILDGELLELCKLGDLKIRVMVEYGKLVVTLSGVMLRIARMGGS